MESNESSGSPGFGVLLRRHRAAAGLSQEELAERAGLSRRGIADLERGVRRTPYAETIRRLSDALQLAPSDRAVFLATVRPTRNSDAGWSVRAPSLAHLPTPISSFVGRQEQIAEVRARLAASRLVTLVGSGGIGKTRLALEVLRDPGLPGFEITWIDLALLRRAELVTQTVAASLRVHERQGQAMLETLIETIGSRPVLLVIDNCEHVLQSCVELVEALLQECSALRVLGTSREPLHILGEVIWRVPGLQVPEPGASTLQEIVATEAVGLFVERAQAVDRTFDVTERDAPALSDLCRRLDGSPLAIELAAANVPMLGVAHIARRLEENFQLLAGGARTAPPRQQTLRGTVDWSYKLLSGPERRLFCQLAVFVGGSTLEAVEAVCGADARASHDVVDRLARLVSTSLVMAEHRQRREGRFRMPETIRGYALEALAQRSDEEDVRQRHFAFFLALAERAELKLAQYGEVWLDRLEDEHDNMRAALQWSLERGRNEDCARLAAALWQFWRIRGHLSEGRHWIDLILTQRDHITAAVRATLLNGAGSLARTQAAYDEAVVLYEEALAEYAAAGDRPGMAYALASLGTVAYIRGEYDRAHGLYEQSLTVGRSVHHDHAIGTALMGHGLLAEAQGQYQEAESFYTQTLACWRSNQSDPAAVAMALDGLAKTASGRGEYARANRLFDEALGLMRGIKHRWGTALVLANWASSVRAQGAIDQAARLYRESLGLQHELGDRVWVARCLQGLSGIASSQGRVVTAARLLGAADALFSALAVRRTLAERTDHERTILTSRAQIDEETWAAELAHGQRMLTDRAVAHALEPIAEVSGVPRPNTFKVGRPGAVERLT